MTNIMINVRQWNSVSYTDAAFVFLLEDYIRWVFVNSDSETFKLILNKSLLRERFIDIKDDEYEMAGFCNSYDLTTSTFSIFGPLNNSWKVEHLNSSSIVLDLTWHRGQGSKFICSNF